MSAFDDSDPVMTGPIRLATRPCMPTKEYQRHLGILRRPRAALSSIRRSTLIGWWMLVTTGSPSRAIAEVAVGEHLVVVHDVEVVAPRPQRAQRPQAEGQRLGEVRGPHAGDLEHVDPVAVLAQMRRAERVVVAVQIQAGQLDQRRALARARGRAGRSRPRRGGRARRVRGTRGAGRCPGRRSAAYSGRRAGRRGAGRPRLLLVRCSRRFAPPRSPLDPHDGRPA